jgi:hypothetical protein
VALSFAGEDRPFAEAVAKGLRKNGVKVFYDDFYAADLWGEDLSSKFGQIYSKQSQYCIMVLSKNYLEKMWTIFERKHAITGLIEKKEKTYVLPVRLDGFNKDIPGLPGITGHLAVSSHEAGKVVNTFLRKIGKAPPQQESTRDIDSVPTKVYIPKIRKEFSDKEKNQFLRKSFEEIIRYINHFADETHKRYPHIEHETDMVTSRKAIFTIYNRGTQVEQFKIWMGGLLGGNEISFLYGSHLDIESDSSMNESISVEEHEGELKLKPMGIGMFGLDRDNLLLPHEAAEYLWKIVCQSFS